MAKMTSKKGKMKMRSKKEGEDGEEINEGGGDGERRKERTPYWRKWMTPARC